MKRRNFIQLSGAALAAIAVPFKLFGNSYTKPVYKLSNLVGPMHRASTICEFNVFVGKWGGRDGYDNLYKRSYASLMAANNIKEKDIINEFYQKYYDDNALLTTCAVEGNYHLYKPFKQSFRKHLRIGQVKEFVDRLSKSASKSSNPKVRENGYNIESFAKEMVNFRDRLS